MTFFVTLIAVSSGTESPDHGWANSCSVNTPVVAHLGQDAELMLLNVTRKRFSHLLWAWTGRVLGVIPLFLCALSCLVPASSTYTCPPPCLVYRTSVSKFPFQDKGVLYSHMLLFLLSRIREFFSHTCSYSCSALLRHAHSLSSFSALWLTFLARFNPDLLRRPF